MKPMKRNDGCIPYIGSVRLSHGGEPYEIGVDKYQDLILILNVEPIISKSSILQRLGPLYIRLKIIEEKNSTINIDVNLIDEINVAISLIINLSLSVKACARNDKELLVYLKNDIMSMYGASDHTFPACMLFERFFLNTGSNPKYAYHYSIVNYIINTDDTVITEYFDNLYIKGTEYIRKNYNLFYKGDLYKKFS